MSNGAADHLLARTHAFNPVINVEIQPLENGFEIFADAAAFVVADDTARGFYEREIIIRFEAYITVAPVARTTSLHRRHPQMTFAVLHTRLFVLECSDEAVVAGVIAETLTQTVFFFEELS